jgi:predicted branched-subunit amino acid permease
MIHFGKNLMSEVSLSSKLRGNPRGDIRSGIKDALPILLAVAPFGAVFGAVAMEAGLSFGEMLLTSMTIYAGASQYVMVELWGQGVPAWFIILSVFAINFRHVLYSASIGRKLHAFSRLQKSLAFFLLVDPQFAASEARAAESGLRPAYYFSYAAVVYATWTAVNCAGALFGALIEAPEKYGVDFILPIYFTGLVVGFHKRPGFLPILLISGGASLAAYFTIGSPWHITLGGLAGLLYAAITSRPEPELADLEEADPGQTAPERTHA